jgi:hypothetical protein
MIPSPITTDREIVMTLQEKLDAFKADFKAGRPPCNAPPEIHPVIERFNGDSSWTLPMPARYVIAADETILYAEVNPDYTRRPEPSDMLPVLRTAKAARAT